MAVWTFVNIEIAGAERLLSLAGISNDLQACVGSCERLKMPLSGGMDDVDAFWTKALVRYARCFKGGIRIVKSDELTSSFTAEDRDKHQFFLDYRDKHIAHSVNEFESHRVRVWLMPEEHGRGISSVSADSTYLVGPSEHVVDSLRQLASKVAAWVQSETESEQAMLKNSILRSHSMDELYSSKALPPRSADYKNVSERRKPA